MKDVNVIKKPHHVEHLKLVIQLQWALDQMMKCLGALEVALQTTGVNQTVHKCNLSKCHWSSNHARYAVVTDRNLCTCWECGEFGHFQCDCPYLQLQQVSSISWRLAKEVFNML